MDLEAFLNSENPDGRFQSSALDELQARTETAWDQEQIRERIEGSTVMVTGAAGSIGSELCRTISTFRPRALIAVDQAETPLFLLERQLSPKFSDGSFRAELGTVSSEEDVDRWMEVHRPEIVYHAAAYKHVAMMERDVFRAVKNNVFGTRVVARAAAKYGVRSFVLISTDKAVRPASVMGATKRVAELVVQSLTTKQGTKFVTARFGNVLGSSGSVLPIFQEQIAAGGPVTVTHPEMRRYFMTAREAAQLVLQASVLGAGGETLVFDMGDPVSIVDLAKELIRRSEIVTGRTVQIAFTGMRPGEKLCEELSLKSEQLVPTAHARIHSVAASPSLSARRLEEALEQLQHALGARSEARVIALLKQLVPDYEPAPSEL